MSDILEPVRGVTPAGAPFVFGNWHKNTLSSRGFNAEARARVKRLIRPTTEGPRFFILTRARSGSTLLSKLLNETDAIHCDLEKLQYKVISPRGHMNALAACRTKPVWGCKFMSYQLILTQRMKRPDLFIADLVEKDGYRPIHLVRSTLRHALSLVVARKTGIYFREHHGDGDGSLPEVSPDLFVTQVRWSEALLELERRLLAPYDPLVVNYDTDLASSEHHQATVDKVCDYIGCPSSPVEAPIKKVLPGSFDNAVANPQELRAALRDAGLGHIA